MAKFSTEMDAVQKVFGLYHGQNRVCVLNITNKCPTACEMCIQASTMEKDEALMSDELIERIISSLPKEKMKYLVIPQGGEPMLYPEKVVKIAELTRKHGQELMLLTSGFWGMDQKMIDIVNNQIKPTFLTLSIDHWHQKKIPVSYIDNIAEKMGDHIMIFSSTCATKKHPVDEVKTKKKWYRVGVQLAPRGGAVNMIDEIDYTDYNGKKTECMITGLQFVADGTIYPSCKNELDGCILGNAFKDDIGKLFKTIQSTPRPRVNLTGKSFGFAQACRLAKIHFLDPKWRDPNYIEDVIIPEGQMT